MKAKSEICPEIFDEKTLEETREELNKDPNWIRFRETLREFVLK